MQEEQNKHVIREFTRIFKNEHNVDGVGHLFDPKFAGKVGMFSNLEDTPNLAMVGLGIKPETSTPKDWQKAADKLKSQRDSQIVRKYYDQSYIKALAAGDTWISMAWSGDVFQANLSAGNEKLKCVIPSEGGLIWTDNMCIPLNAAHPVDAITYMDYVYQPSVAATLGRALVHIPVDGERGFQRIVNADSRST